MEVAFFCNSSWVEYQWNAGSLIVLQLRGTPRMINVDRITVHWHTIKNIWAILYNYRTSSEHWVLTKGHQNFKQKKKLTYIQTFTFGGPREFYYSGCSLWWGFKSSLNGETWWKMEIFTIWRKIPYSELFSEIHYIEYPLYPSSLISRGMVDQWRK